MINPVLKTALIHGGKVFLYAGVSALVPILLSLLANDARYLALAPVINMVWAGIQKYIDENNLLAGQSESV